MGGSLIRFVSGASGIGYGVNVWPIAPPRSVSGVSQNAIGMVADLPWGKVNEIVEVTTPAEFFAEFYPDAFNSGAKDYATYPAILALLNKPLFTKGGLKVVRIQNTGAVKAFKTDTGTGTVTVTAKYYGDNGNEIYRQWTAASDADPLKRNLVISIGTEYTATYENLTVSTVEDVDDPYVDVTTNTLTVFPVAGAAAALATGADGTAVAGDYTGANKGIQIFYGASVEVDVLFCAEVPNVLVDDINAGLKLYAAEDKGLAVLSTPDGQTSATALTYLSGETLQDDRLHYGWPRVKTTNFFDADVDEIEVDGNAFAAAAIANSDAWISPGGAPGAQFLTGITGLETESTSRSTLDSLRDAGVSPWFMSTAHGGAIIAKALTTDTAGTKVKQRRLRDYLEVSLAQYAELYVETPLDIDLAEQSLGEYTGSLVSAYNAFLENEKIAQHVKNYSVDPFSLNTEESIDAGRWIIYVAVETYSDQDEIVLKTEIGETVTVSSSS